MLIFRGFSVDIKWQRDNELRADSCRFVTLRSSSCPMNADMVDRWQLQELGNAASSFGGQIYEQHPEQPPSGTTITILGRAVSINDSDYINLALASVAGRSTWSTQLAQLGSAQC